MPPRMVIEIVSAIAKPGLRARPRVLHRYVNPGNILVANRRSTSDELH